MLVPPLSFGVIQPQRIHLPISLEVIIHSLVIHHHLSFAKPDLHASSECASLTLRRDPGEYNYDPARAVCNGKGCHLKIPQLVATQAVSQSLNEMVQSVTIWYD